MHDIRAEVKRKHHFFLSVRQTCKYMGVDILDFLRSGEKDIHAFAEGRRRRKRPSQTGQTTDLPADATKHNEANK